MRGIPKVFATRQDLINTHVMALRGKLDKREWKATLEELCQEVKFAIPVIEKGPDYIVIPKTDRHIPESYGTAVESTIEDHKGNVVWKTMKIFTAEPDAIDTVWISGGYPKLEHAGVTLGEVLQMIREIRI